MEKLVLNGLLMVGSILIVIPKSVESRPSGPMELQSHYVQAIAAYRRLERILPKEELRAVTSLGLLNGARQAEEQMEQHLVKAIRDLLLQMNLTESGSVMMGKIDAIEEQLSRDQRALEILTRVMDVVSQAKDDHEFRAELRQMAQQQKEDELHSQQLSADLTDQPKLGQRLGQLRSHIIRQVPQLKNELEAKIELALQHLLQQAAEDGLLGRAKQKVLHKRQIKKGVDQRKPQQQEQQKQQEQEQQEQDEAEERQMPEEMRIIKSILSEAHDLRFQDDFQENMLEQQPARRLKMEPPTSELDDLEINVKDPEEEGPPQPLTFTKNLITSFLEAKFRPNSEEGSEERHGSAELPRPRKKKEGGGGWAAAAASSFDSGGFVKHLASHLVSNALGLILNAGLGAAGGASSAAKNIFASSSMGHHAKPAEHHHRSGHAYYDNEPF
ncbi:putative uncharacterized protein DDB_G0271606 isoform X3 [Drosophila gunungcola]|uniref:putative uncharacterized protein DDB_G0271606 isoform X3 n=1 Tax=Drosophila gunungcola TaxID=103775 RepID=UPI0022E27D66|nr:putative uncharacterized protein DDB_G0271606 isoform X3 [Drosophila gunungcola]